MLFRSCSNNESDYEVIAQKTNNTISFNTLRDKLVSRVANDSADNYYVYAYATDTIFDSWYFSTAVNSSTGTTNYYWPRSGTVSFYSFCTPSPTHI